MTFTRLSLSLYQPGMRRARPHSGISGPTENPFYGSIHEEWDSCPSCLGFFPVPGVPNELSMMKACRSSQLRTMWSALCLAVCMCHHIRHLRERLPNLYSETMSYSLGNFKGMFKNSLFLPILITIRGSNFS